MSLPAQPTVTAVPTRTAALHYGLAYLGVHLAFMPLLVLLVPRRIELLAPGQSAEALSWVLLAGAVAAGAGNVVAGHIGDRWLARHGNRRGLVAIGVALLAASYLLLAASGSLTGLIAAIVVYQLALNCAFAPLGALLADHFPDHTKGRMAGIMTAALPLSSLSVVLVGWLFPHDGAGAFLFAGALAAACFLPLLVRWPLGKAMPSRPDGPAQADTQGSAPWVPRDFAIAWGSKLAVQLGAAFVQGYIYLYLAALPWVPGEATALLAELALPAAVLAIGATLGAGLVSDRLRRRRMPLALASLALALGLVLLAWADSVAVLLVGYAAFQVGLAAFSSVDMALIGQLVSGQPNRGALLGVMNLTNTLPSALAPVLTLVAVQQGALQQTLGELFLLCAGLSLVAGLAILRIRSVA